MATRILFFGALKDTAGVSERIEELPASVTKIETLIDFIANGDRALHDALNAPSVRIAVNQQLTGRDAMIKTPEEIAFMPPFSGG